MLELLIVISIIALLLAVLLPALSSAREKGKMVKCLANMRSIGQETTNFMADYGRFPLVTDEVGVNQADPERQRFAYGAEGELLSWPAALSKGYGLINENWDWGARATSYEGAKAKESFIDSKAGLNWLVCPSDRLRLATPFYPRNKGSNNNGLIGVGDQGDPSPSNGQGASYWGRLSYAVNEDICGAEVSESNGNPACWRRLDGAGCRGEFNYPPAHPCGSEDGRRLQGNLERVFQSSSCGLVFEAGRDDVSQDITGFANLMTSAQAPGGFLSDFQQWHSARMPTSRHPSGRLNVLFADIHGETIRPIKFNPANGLPTEYSPRVRVSPYIP